MRVGVNSGSILLGNLGAFNGLSQEKAICCLKEAGYDAIDFDLNLVNYNNIEEEKFDEYFLNLKAIADKCGIEIYQTHSQCWGYSRAITQEYFDITVKDIRATSLLGAKYIVIHPLRPPQRKFDEYKEQMKKVNMDFFGRLRPYLEKYDVIECIENMFGHNEDGYYPTFSRPEEMVEYIEQLGTDRFGACLDTGHMFLTCDKTGDTVENAVRKLGKYIKVLHVHDNRKEEDSHFPPYYGDIEWANVVKAVKEIGFKGVWNLELSLYKLMNYEYSAQMETLKYIRRLADFDRIIFETNK